MPLPALRLIESREGKPLDDLKVVPVGAAVPDALRPILDKDSTEAAATFLMTLLDVVAGEAIDKETTNARVNPGKTRDVKSNLTVSNWGTGGGLGMFGGKLYRFKAAALTTFFARVFDKVKETIPGARYSRNNLFHGHAVFDKVDGAADFRIVFHAYEYPKNLEKAKSELAHEAEPDVAPFDDGGEAFYMRNAIWSMRSNKVFNPRYFAHVVLMTKDLDDFPPYGALVEGTTGCAISQAKVGQEIIGFNTFPSEQVALFLKQ